jgi:hypothetical protein
MQQTDDNKMHLFVDYCTYAVDAVDEGVVAGVAHGQPVEQEEEDVDILKPEHEAHFESFAINLALH